MPPAPQPRSSQDQEVKSAFQISTLVLTGCAYFYRTRVRSLFTLVTHSLTNSLTDCCLVNFIDVTLACEDANSKLVDVVTVADDDLVGNNLLQIWKLRFGQKANLLLRL